MPNGRQQPTQGMSLDEFKPVACVGCGSTRRKPVVFAVNMQHRLKPSLVVEQLLQVSFCAGCGTQLTDQGHPTPADDPFFLSLRERSNLWKA